MILVQTLLNTRLRPIRQRFKRAHVRHVVVLGRLKDGFGTRLPGTLPRATPEDTALSDLARKEMLFKRKIQHIVDKNNARL